MARVELAETAVEDLHWLIRTHSLPEDTRPRVRRVLVQLEQFSHDSAQSCTAGGRVCASSSARGAGCW